VEAARYPPGKPGGADRLRGPDLRDFWMAVGSYGAGWNLSNSPTNLCIFYRSLKRFCEGHSLVSLGSRQGEFLERIFTHPEGVEGTPFGGTFPDGLPIQKGVFGPLARSFIDPLAPYEV